VRWARGDTMTATDPERHSLAALLRLLPFDFELTSVPPWKRRYRNRNNTRRRDRRNGSRRCSEPMVGRKRLWEFSERLRASTGEVFRQDAGFALRMIAQGRGSRLGHPHAGDGNRCEIR